MTSFQSSLGDRDIADELAESQRQISIAEFFEKNKQMLGFDSEARAIVTAVKEGVDNSLTWSTPFVYRRDGETRHEPIGAAIDDLIEQNREDVLVKRDGDLEKLRVDGVETLSFDDEYDVDFQSVSSVFRHRVNSDIYRITVEGGREVELTDYHSVFVLRDGGVVSVETSDITEDDYVVLPDTEWGDGTRERIDLVSEMLALPPERTEAIGLYGVEELIDEWYDEIWEQADEQYRMSDYRKCDRLPLNVIRKLDLDSEEYEDCELGVRFGKHTIPAVLDVDDDLAELLGLYAAEGCVTGGDSGHEKVYLSLGSHETDLIDHAENLVESVFGIPPSTVSAHDSATNVTIPSKIVGFVVDRIFEAGSGASEKRVPRFVFDFPKAHRERFVLGYAAGDGYPTEAIIPVLRGGGGLTDIEEYRLVLSTMSDRLSSGLRYLLSSIGYDTTHEHQPAETRSINGREKEFGESHLLYLRTDQSSTSIKRLPAEHVLQEVDDAKLAYNLDGRQDRVETDHALALADGGKLEFRDSGRRIAEGDLTALPVTDIEQIEYDGEWVYDVSVPGDENFMAGTGPLACHNSLDATEEAGFLPDIYVEIKDDGDYYTLVVEDNGPGITKEQIPSVFGKLLYGSRFGARAQARGQQGIGISAAVMYAQLTSGTPAKITSRTPSREAAQYFELIIDTENNEPEIRTERETTWERPHGTRIELRMEANMRARRQLHDYITHTAVVNPHARIELVEPSETFKFDRATDELPEETEEIRPHPHGVELGTVITMLEDTDSYSLSGFLQGEFTRVGGKTAENIIDAFRDRHFGREMGWTPPRASEEVDLEEAIAGAVANKSAEATESFAEAVAERLEADAPATHSGLEAIVAEVAESIEEEYGTTFGATVREKAAAAAWDALTADRITRLYDLVDAATTDRKDEPILRAFTERLAAKFAETERDRATRGAVREFVDRAADMTEERDGATFGETARENVTEALWGAMETVPDDAPGVRDVAGDRDAAAAFLEAMRAIDVMSPPTNCLSPIRAALIEEGLRKEFDADFLAAETREAGVHGGDPFIVEAGIAYGGELEDGGVDLMRFANRVPLVYQRGACAITDVVRDIDWRNYGLDQPGGSGLPAGPAVIMVHVASTNVPFTSESKDAVANVPEIEKEIELAVREVARGMKSHLSERRSLEKRRRKQTVIADILPKMARKLASVAGREEPDVDTALARIMNNVLVSRAIENGTVRLVVENNTDAGVDLDVTEVVSAEPGEVSDGTAVEMDGEWFLKWEPRVAAGEEATLSYSVADGASFDVTVDGIEAEKLTIDT